MGRTSERLKRQKHFKKSIEPIIKILAIAGLAIAVLIIILDHFGAFSNAFK